MESDYTKYLRSVGSAKEAVAKANATLRTSTSADARLTLATAEDKLCWSLCLAVLAKIDESKP